MILPDLNAGPDIEKNNVSEGIYVETALNYNKAVTDKYRQMDRRKGSLVKLNPHLLIQPAERYAGNG